MLHLFNKRQFVSLQNNSGYRTHRTAVESSLVPIGAPQDTVLGPESFIMYIKNLRLSQGGTSMSADESSILVSPSTDNGV